jgi:hypothetical protein
VRFGALLNAFSPANLLLFCIFDLVRRFFHERWWRYAQSLPAQGQQHRVQVERLISLAEEQQLGRPGLDTENQYGIASSGAQRTALVAAMNLSWT